MDPNTGDAEQAASGNGENGHEDIALPIISLADEVMNHTGNALRRSGQMRQEQFQFIQRFLRQSRFQFPELPLCPLAELVGVAHA